MTDGPIEVTDGTFTALFGLTKNTSVNVPSGGCEKIDFSLTSDPESEKLRARMPSKRLLGSRHTFPFKNRTLIKSGKPIFSHPPVTTARHRCRVTVVGVSVGEKGKWRTLSEQ